MLAVGRVEPTHGSPTKAAADETGRRSFVRRPRTATAAVAAEQGVAAAAGTASRRVEGPPAGHTALMCRYAVPTTTVRGCEDAPSRGMASVSAASETALIPFTAEAMVAPSATPVAT